VPPPDAAVVVQKLAAQAEEQILQAAEAGALRPGAGAAAGLRARSAISRSRSSIICLG
jgi:hypothetical protein